MADSKYMTVHEMAERLAKITGSSQAYHARQIRHWAQNGVLAVKPLGDSVTSPNGFTEVELCRALVLNAFTEFAVISADDLITASRLMENISSEDEQRVFPFVDGSQRKPAKKFAHVLELIKRDEQDWYFEIFLVLGGKPMGCMTTFPHPSRKIVGEISHLTITVPVSNLVRKLLEQ